MPNPPTVTRRRFLQSSAAVAAASALAAPYIIPASALGADGRPAPSNRITMGCIGLGGRGSVNLQQFLSRPEVQMVALCDVDAGSDRYEDAWTRGLAPAVETVKKHYAAKAPAGAFNGPDGYADFRPLLARADIDAVCISTPDHWHGLITVAAARAGKDVYCEKPMSLTVAEGRAMADAVRRYARVFQVGSQRRSSARCRASCELVRNNRIGKLHTVHVGLMGPYWLRKNHKPSDAPEPVPAGFDYDLWLGPAPAAPYTYNRCHWNFRWNLDYSGGNLTDWGAHMIDMAHWGMGTEHTGPVEVEGKGTFPARASLYNAATGFDLTFTYANGVKMLVKSSGSGVRWEGSDGSVELEGATKPAHLAREVIGPGETRLYVSDDHHANFLECVRTRRDTAAPAEVAHRSITPSHLGNIAMQLGRKLKWDPAKERFENDPEADRFLSRPWREPWSI